MGFWSSLKKQLPNITKAVVPFVPGAGAAVPIVELILSKGGESAPEDASKALAVAVDDLQIRLAAVEKALKAKTAAKK